MRPKDHLENIKESHRTTPKTRKLSEIDISIIIKCVQKEMENNLECFCSKEEPKYKSDYAETKQPKMYSSFRSANWLINYFTCREKQEDGNFKTQNPVHMYRNPYKLCTSINKFGLRG